jgi:glycerol-3-phosphate acyltransferase PlsX
LSALRIAVDAMGGDHGVSVTVPAALSVLKAHPELHLILVGQEDVLRAALIKHKANHHPRLSIQHASEVVDMGELPSHALRNKKDSSMRVAINLVKEGQAQACVSAGNTGALMATARFVLKVLPGIDRPAIVYAMPGLNHETGARTSVHMLDLGANVDCSAEHLFQFAVMGSILVSAVNKLQRPRVALLNIGEEEIKGLENIKQASKMLHECSALNYIGFVEGNDIYRDKADVIVCDGFIGNIALKTSEGTAKFILQIVKSAFTRSWLTKLCGLLAFPVLKHIKNDLNVNRYNGASFLGLKGIVIKSHGGAEEEAFAAAIKRAIFEVEQDVPRLISAQVASLLGQPASELKDEAG